VRTPFARLTAAAAFLLAAAHVGVLSAQSDRSASLSLVTAELLVRFARFTEWPAETLAPDGRLVFCATDPLVADALTEVTAKQTVGAHAVSARLVQASAVPRECSVLYLGGVDARRLTAIIAAVPNANALTVGDADAFTRAGGVIQVYVEDGRMRFTVNLKAAERARLHLSSKMLTFARIVRE
jgi:hypothetical protein